MTTFNLFDPWRKTLADASRAAAVAGTLKMAIFKSFTPNQNTHTIFTTI